MGLRLLDRRPIGELKKSQHKDHPMKYVLVPIAEGIEEIEAVCIIDTLRRADVNVTVASVSNQLEICASRGTKLIADTTISTCTTKLYDMIAPSWRYAWRHTSRPLRATHCPAA